MEFKVDGEFKKLIPPLSSDERELLEKSIVTEGCRDALVIWQNILLDGHNRLEICKVHNIPFETINAPQEIKDRTDAKIWIRNNQRGRRNLTPAWKIELELGNKEDLEAKGKAKMSEAGKMGRAIQLGGLSLGDNPPVEKHNTRTEIAKAAGVSTGQVGMAEQVRKNDPELWEKTKAGDISVKQAYTKVKKNQKANETKKKREELAKKATSIPESTRWHGYCANLKEWQSEKQYDFIITDPPYPKEYLALWEVLGKRANEWLKDGGLLIAMSGQSYLNKIYRLLSEHLTYYWTAAYLTPGQPTPLRQINVNTTWKPLLIFRKGEYKGKIFGDVFKSDGNDKTYHEWGQSESGMFDIVSKICLPGQSILDPFCGAGTTGVAALKHGCLFDGVDIDENNINIMKARLTQ